MAIAERPAAWLAERRSGAVPSTAELPSLGVVVALARADGPRMLRHPSYLLILPLGVLLMGVRSLDQISFEMVGPLIFLLIVGLFVGTLITGNLAAVRSRRDGTDELFGSTPSPAVARTAGHLLGVAFGPGVVALALTVATLIFWLLAPDSRLMEDLEPEMLPQFPLAIVAIGALGIAVGRWWQSVFGGVFLLAAHIFTGVIWAVPWIVWDEDGSVHAWHLLYLAAFIVGFGAIAFLRDRRGPALIAASVLGVGAAVVAAVEQVPPGGY
jgi:hypothetical protein